MKQRSHKEVGYLRHAVAVLVPKHIANRLALLVQTRIIATLLPHLSVILILHHIVRRLVYIELLIVKVIRLHTHLHRSLTLGNERFSQFIKLSLGEFKA